MSTIVNIAAYKYLSLDHIPERRAELQRITRELNLRGTILISQEGINMFLAGDRESMDTYLQFVRDSHPQLADLAVKESITDYQPFQRMVVKVKREIIPVGVDGELEIDTPEGRKRVERYEDASPKLPPKELKEWLDDGRPVTLLDTRNDYETDLGTFQNAIDLRLKTFRDFPDAAAALPDEVKKNPVVMFCTGGIRCEKIGPYMKGLGFEQIYQLEGGILKYFEECNQAHYDGTCFVFDQRVAVDPALTPADSYECYACKHVLTPEDLQSEKYVVTKSCPYCYQSDEELKEIRQATIRQIAGEQRGSTPYENQRWISIPQRVAGKSLIDALTETMPGYGREAWLEAISKGLIQSPRRGLAAASAQEVVQEGARYLHVMPDYLEPPVSAAIDLVYEDEAMVVISKGAPLPVHPSGRFNRNTLLAILHEAYHPEKLRPCHRLDMNTTGLVVFARKYKYSKDLQNQFAAGTVEKTYQVLVEGNPSWDSYDCTLAISSETLQNGGRRISEEGQHAETRFAVVERRGETTLLEARLITGRTHQIRLHAAALGFPVVNDPLYLPGGESLPQPDEIKMREPMGLHSHKIALRHPITKEQVEFIGRPPM